MAVGNAVLLGLQGYGASRNSGGIFYGPSADLHRHLLPVMLGWGRLQGRHSRHFAGYFSWSRVHRPPHAAVWLAVHGGTAAGAGPFSADSKRPLAAAAAVCPVDQPARLVGLWPGSTGANHCLRPGGGRMGPGGSAALVPRGAEKTSACVGRFPGRTLCQPLWLQAGALSI